MPYISYGGAAGGGKTYALLLELLRNTSNSKFNAAVFRRNSSQIFNTGGLWDEACSMYIPLGAECIKTPYATITFPSGAKVRFAHLQYEKDVHAWQGGQVCLLCYDELCHFTESQFFYMLSRNRSACGVKPYVRATCNPDAESWVSKFIGWWIDQETGYPISERSGKLRYFIRREETIYWADAPEELWTRFDLKTEEERREPKSVTFIASSVYDNKILMTADPGYLANLKAMSVVERERLLYGNWKIKAAGGLFFKRTQVELCDVPPTDLQFTCRAWDLAATEDRPDGDADYTAGVLMGIRKDQSIVVLDVINQRIKAGDVEKLVYNTAVTDRKKYGFRYKVRIPQDPGAAGKIVASTYVKKLSGFNVKALPVTGSKQLRATPFAAQWQNGNISIVAADWNDMYFSQLESFPELNHDDMVDASSDAFNELASAKFTLKTLV